MDHDHDHDHDRCDHTDEDENDHDQCVDEPLRLVLGRQLYREGIVLISHLCLSGFRLRLGLGLGSEFELGLGLGLGLWSTVVSIGLVSCVLCCV
jgi:hypothetical protein